MICFNSIRERLTAAHVRRSVLSPSENCPGTSRTSQKKKTIYTCSRLLPPPASSVSRAERFKTSQKLAPSGEKGRSCPVSFERLCGKSKKNMASSARERKPSLFKWKTLSCERRQAASYVAAANASSHCTQGQQALPLGNRCPGPPNKPASPLFPNAVSRRSSLQSLSSELPE